MKTRRMSCLLLIALLAFLLLGPGCAHGLFYHPTRAWEGRPDPRVHPKWENVFFHAADGVRLNGWWLPAHVPVKGTVVHFHGNAINISNHFAFAEWLPAAGYNVLLFDYRGYGQSEGRITRRGLVRDGVAAIAYAAERSETPPGRLFVWGQSLGGTVALQSLVHSPIPVQAAIIDSTFYSHPAIADDFLRRFPWFLAWLRPLRPLLVKGGYDAPAALKKLPPLPLLFLHGENDPVIPSKHSRRLYAIAKEPKTIHIVPGAGHCDAVLRFPDQVRPLLLDFLAGAK